MPKKKKRNIIEKRKKVPEISRFYGIIIKMYFLDSEHNPPHIHAIYNKSIAIIDIQSLEKIEFMIDRFGKDHSGFTSFWN